ncbi:MULTISPECIES: RNB domain-containing ribonuclease [unclassified Cyanobium]|uniref:RNB domain-containing ribonuclease n=1 Tax=unclassified Cyanobium TaxID=2627006 RepID=UPI0020CFC87D|nr:MULTISPECIES: RNB domain-containing ribonuclease [unclassified Cyanobium]MCP9833147.1 RNB domain-containing ribonuclease [Cyanobium sp. La Preciosa 7G6]MCP9935990.1 RNB domain-containing ribonuclease [Cyanobium sp. Aljojuca 7A6]
MPAASRRFTAGDLVGLHDDSRSLLAVVVAEKGTRLDLRVGFEAKAVQRGVRQLDLIAALPGDQPPPSRLSQPPWGLSQEALQQAVPSPRELGAAWLLLLDEPASLDLGDFVDLIGDGGDPIQRAASWLWLQGPQTLFRWRQQQVEARPLLDVRRLRRDARRQKLAEQRRHQWQDALRQRQPIDPQQLEPEQRQQLALLREWAGGDISRPLPDDLHRALQAAHCPIEASPIRHLLVDLGQWERHHLPSLENTTWQAGFSEELEGEARRLVDLAATERPGDERRRDLTGLHTVTIDDEDTRDIDDGLSLERGADGTPRLWIHIADPGRLVAADSPLDTEARRRASSLYLARGSLPMFPEVLSTGPMSLRMGQRSAALSLWVELASDGTVAGYGLEPSWVQPAYRLSYADADELIELAPPQERYLEEIHALMELRRRWRLARGALNLDQPEGRIRCDHQGAQLEITEPSPSRTMVAEAMILAGAVIAQLGQTQNLALPYRSQLAAELPPEAELQALPAGPVRHAAIKRCLSRGLLGTSPAPHFSLGLPCYVQATSPIRRYNDLLVQRQLLAHQQGEPVQDEAQLGTLLSELEGAIRQGLQIAREDQRHWQQVWFEAQEQHQWPGLFLRWLRPQDRLGLVHLPDLAMDLAAECHGDPSPGDGLLVRLQQVDSLRDLLRFTAAP